MSYTKSLSLIVTDAKRLDANKLMDALGRGLNTFGTVELSPSGARASTHWGAHTYDDELEAIVASKALPSGINWSDYGLTANGAQAALNAITYTSKVDRNSKANFNAQVSAMGLKRIVDPT